ncbi:MAG: hypothetical protein AAGG50_18090 [Bacteroidota bacterium]
MATAGHGGGHGGGGGGGGGGANARTVTSVPSDPALADERGLGEVPLHLEAARCYRLNSQPMTAHDLRYGDDYIDVQLDSAADHHNLPVVAHPVPTTEDPTRARWIPWLPSSFIDAGRHSNHRVQRHQVLHCHLLDDDGSTTPYLHVTSVCPTIPALLALKLWDRAGGAFVSGDYPYLLTPDARRIPVLLDTNGDYWVRLFAGDAPSPTTSPTPPAEPRRRTTAAVVATLPPRPALVHATTTPKPGPVRLAIAALVTAALIGQYCAAPSQIHAVRTAVKFMPGLDMNATRAHQTFAHAGPRRLQEITDRYGLNITDAPNQQASMLGRLRAAPTHANSTSGTPTPWRTVETDIQGKFGPPTLNGGQYAVEFAFRDPPAIGGAIIKRKSDAIHELRPFIVKQRSLGRDPKELRADLGGEFDNDAFRKEAAALGLTVDYVSPERHVNSAELAHLRSADVMRSNNALVKGVLHDKFWGYSLMYAWQQIDAAGNWSSTHTDDNDDSPVQDLSGYAPYGSVVAYRNPDLPKNDLRASLGIYLGPRKDGGPGDVWVVPLPKPGSLQDDLRLVRTVSTVHFLAAPGEPLDLRNLKQTLRDLTPELCPPDADTATATIAGHVRQLRAEIELGSRSARAYATYTANTISDTTVTADVDAEPDSGRIYCDLEPPDPSAPRSMREALTRDDAAKWDTSIAKEYGAYIDFGAIQPTPRDDVPSDAEIYNTIDNYRYKRDGTCKTRLCLDGRGVHCRDAAHAADRDDHDDEAPHSSTARTRVYSSSQADPTCVLLFIACCVRYGYTIVAEGDAVAAYLQGAKLPSAYKCYMRPPRFLKDWFRRCFGDPMHWPYDPYHTLWLVVRPVYGHPIAGRLWEETFSTFIIDELHFVRSTFHPCFFVRIESDGPPTLMLSIVDNVPLAGQPHHVAAVREALNARFAMTWNDRCDDICGMCVDYDADGSITVHQRPYIEKILTRVGLAHVTTGPRTPLDAKFNVDPNVPDVDLGDILDGHQQRALDVKPRECIGWLMYLRATVPTSSRATHTLASASNVWAPKHDLRLYRLFLWLAAHGRTLGIRFSAAYRGKFELRAFVDENYGCELSTTSSGRARSRLGGFILLNGGCIYSASHRAAVSCYSTAEVALLATSLIVRCLTNIRRLLYHMDGQHPPATDVRSDNTPALKQIRKRQLGNNMRHLRIALDGIITAIDSGDVKTKYINTAVNPADTFASYEPASLFNRNTSFVSGFSDTTSPDFTRLSRPDQEQYIKTLEAQK